MEWLKRLLGLKEKSKEAEKPDHDFKVGQIYQMAPTEYSHVKKPYYVLIKRVGANYIKTSIPDEHDLVIEKNTFEWGYHTDRMTLIGTFETHAHLLYHQPLD